MNIKSSKELVEEANKEIKVLSAEELNLLMKRRNNSYRYKGYKRTLERRDSGNSIHIPVVC